MLVRTRCFVFGLLLLSATLYAQVEKGLKAPEDMNGNIPGKRIALLIGNATYKHAGVLANPTSDIELMSNLFKQIGFEVRQATNLNLEGMNKVLDSFTEEIRIGRYEVALYYYSGHGVEVNGVNYLLPIEAELVHEVDAKYRCIDAAMVLEKMATAQATVKIMILDACRSNHLTNSWRSSNSGNFVPMTAPKGSYIAFSTSSGKNALDGKNGNSPYTLALAKYLPQEDLEIGQLFNRVNNYTQTLAKSMNQDQVPFAHSSLNNDFYFVSKNRVSQSQVHLDEKPFLSNTFYDSLRQDTIEIDTALAHAEPDLVEAIHSRRNGGSGERAVKTPQIGLALVIGNSSYSKLETIENAVKDAEQMEKAMLGVGFEVIKVLDSDLKDFKNGLQSFVTKLEKGEYENAIFYYAGHAIAYDGENYLVPVDAKLRRLEEIKSSCFNIQEVIGWMTDARVESKIVLLEAARKNKAVKKLNLSYGLCSTYTPKGMLIGYSAPPGDVVISDGTANSKFTRALTKYLIEPGLRLSKAIELMEEPSSNLDGIAAEERGLFFSNNLGSDKNLVKIFFDDPIVGRMIFVRGGLFQMGCATVVDSCEFDELPIHPVQLSDFYIGQTEVTKAQWRAVMGSENVGVDISGCLECPIEGVSQYWVYQFIEKLNALHSGKPYRLPTEAEWEYAARGGARSKGFQFSGSNNLEEVAWVSTNSGHVLHPVGQKKCNELGLFDMSGNVWERCSDWFFDYSPVPQVNPKGPDAGTFRILRGGAIRSNATSCRVSFRNISAPEVNVNTIGFRLVRER